MRKVKRGHRALVSRKEELRDEKRSQGERAGQGAWRVARSRACRVAETG